jgi:hypothetical protein
MFLNISHGVYLDQSKMTVPDGYTVVLLGESGKKMTGMQLLDMWDSFKQKNILEELLDNNRVKNIDSVFYHSRAYTAGEEINDITIGFTKDDTWAPFGAYSLPLDPGFNDLTSRTSTNNLLYDPYKTPLSAYLGHENTPKGVYFLFNCRKPLKELTMDMVKKISDDIAMMELTNQLKHQDIAQERGVPMNIDTDERNVMPDMKYIANKLYFTSIFDQSD